MLNFTKEQIEEAINNTKSMAKAAKELGVCYATFKKYADEYNLFSPNQSGKGLIKGKRYKRGDDVFKKGRRIGTMVLIKFLKLERGWKCEECGLDQWQGKDLTLELDHINGDTSDNTRSNLRFLCPNCHSQTDTWRGRNNVRTNFSKGKKVSDEQLTEALLSSPNVRQALMSVGLAPKGGNYSRAYELITKFDLSING